MKTNSTPIRAQVKKQQSRSVVFREGRSFNTYRGTGSGRVTGSYNELRAHIEALRARDEGVK
jgi:hypothetical protein